MNWLKDERQRVKFGRDIEEKILDHGLHTIPPLISWQVYASNIDIIDVFYAGIQRVLKPEEEKLMLPPESFVVP